MATLKPNGDFGGSPHPTRYELVDKDGKVWGGRVFNSAVEAGKCAALLWPDQEQDEDRTGKEWDVQVCGCGK